MELAAVRETLDKPSMRRRHLRERIALATIFFADGCALGVWAAHIPVIAQTLRLQAGGLAIALFGLVIGAMLAMPLAGAIAVRVGSRRLVIGAASISLLALAGPGAAPSLPWLTACTFAFGATRGLLEVAMNANSIALQRDIGRPILSSFHAFFSLGGFAGAGIGALELWLGGPAFVHLAVVAVILAAVAAVASGRVHEDGPPDSGVAADGPRRILTPALVSLAVAGFCVFLSEGALTDWSAVFLRTVIGVPVSAAAAGYAAFALAMTIGRFSGDRIVQRLGPRSVVVGGTLAAGIGIALALLAPSYGMTLAGFGLVGIGLANAVPVIFGAAGDAVGGGVGVATVSTLGYAGFLTGPPLIGAIAQLAGLRAGLALVGLSCVLAALTARRYIRAR